MSYKNLERAINENKVDGGYIVYNIGNNAPSVIHDSLDNAVDEVKRLTRIGCNRKPWIIARIERVYQLQLVEQIQQERDKNDSELELQTNPYKDKDTNRILEALKAIKPVNTDEQKFLEGILKQIKTFGQFTITVQANYLEGYDTKIEGMPICVRSKEKFAYAKKWFGKFPSYQSKVYTYLTDSGCGEFTFTLNVEDLKTDMDNVNHLVLNTQNFPKFNFFVTNVKKGKEIEISVETRLKFPIPVLKLCNFPSPTYVTFLIYDALEKRGLNVEKAKTDILNVSKTIKAIKDGKKPVKIFGNPF